MNLKRNEINIKVIEINKSFYMIVTDLTVVLLQIDTEMYNNLNNNEKIEYKDVCNIVVDNSCKVLTNELKLKALLIFVDKNKELFTQDLMNSLKNFTSLTNTELPKKDLKLVKILTEKLNKTEKRYQDRRRVERMIKEFKYYLIEQHNKSAVIEKDLIPLELSTREIYLNGLHSVDTISTIVVPLPNRGVCHIKEKNLYKSKYTKNMQTEDLVYLMFKCINKYRKTPLPYESILNRIKPKLGNIRIKKI